MKNRTMSLLILASLGGILTTAGCSDGKREAGAPGTSPTTVKGVTVEPVRQQELAEQLEAVGTVKAVNIAVVAARIAGAVTNVPVKEGDRVRKGQLLATLEATETTAGAAAAQAGAEEAKRALDEALARKKLADATFQRYSRLFSEQAVTRQEFETRQTEQEVAAEGVARAESRLSQARSTARAATTMADYTRVVAPINGVVTNKAVDRGATVFPGVPLMTVEGEGEYRLEVQAPESIKQRIVVGQSVEVKLDGSDQTRSGRIVEVVPIVDPASRTFVTKIAVTGKGLRTGGYGRAFFPAGTVKGLLVPAGAIVDRGALTSLWVVDSKEIARMRLVKTGRRIGDRIEVLAGLSDGERIVTKGVEKVIDGAKVE